MWGRGQTYNTALQLQICTARAALRPHASRTHLQLTCSISLSPTVSLLLLLPHAVPVKPTSSHLAKENQSGDDTLVQRVQLTCMCTPYLTYSSHCLFLIT